MNELAHYAAGVLVAGAFGFRGGRQAALGLFAVLPDWDALTTPLIPVLLDALDPSREAARALLILLGHGAFSHSLLGVALLLAAGFAAGLRGRALAAAATALASHWILDLAVPWDVWLLLPFSQAGVGFGWLDLNDPAATLALAGLALASLAPALWARLRKRALEQPPWLPRALLAVATLVVLAPLPLQVALERDDGAQAEAVAYLRFVRIVPEDANEVRLEVVDAWEGGLVNATRAPRVALLTNETPGSREAAALAERMLADMGPTNPLAFALLRVHDHPGGLFRVEAREAREVATGQVQVAIEFLLDRELRLVEVRLVRGGAAVEAPVALVPTWVPLAPTPPSDGP